MPAAGQFDHHKHQPAKEFASAVLDITGVWALFKSITGHDPITDEGLSDMERALGAAMGVIDVLSLVLAVPSLGASRLGASSARAALLALLVNAAATGASVLTVDMARDLGLPSWASTLVAIGVGLTVAVVGGKILIYGPRGQQIGPAITPTTTRVVPPSVGLGGMSQTPKASLPPNVRQIYDRYDQHGWKGNVRGQTPETSAGGVFDNDPQRLPVTDSTGQSLTYREFDVNNKIPGVKRDAERFVRCDQNEKVYYTNDHYLTFTEVVP